MSIIHVKMFNMRDAQKRRRMFLYYHKWKMKKQSRVSSVANHILNNALHVYFLSNESNTLAQLTEVECLYDFSFNSFCPYYSALTSFNPFSILLAILVHLVILWCFGNSEEIFVCLDDAHEVSVESEENGGLEENLEEVVLLLELLVLVF